MKFLHSVAKVHSFSDKNKKNFFFFFWRQKFFLGFLVFFCLYFISLTLLVLLLLSFNVAVVVAFVYFYLSFEHKVVCAAVPSVSAPVKYYVCIKHPFFTSKKKKKKKIWLLLLLLLLLLLFSFDTISGIFFFFIFVVVLPGYVSKHVYMREISHIACRYVRAPKHVHIENGIQIFFFCFSLWSFANFSISIHGSVSVFYFFFFANIFIII